MESISSVYERITAIQKRMRDLHRAFVPTSVHAGSKATDVEPKAAFKNLLSSETNTTPSTKKFHTIIKKAAQQYNLPSSLIHAIIKQESNYNPKAVSSKGALGLMQLMPQTAQELGVKNPLSPEENVMGGTRYLKNMMHRHNNNLIKSLAAYNAGPNALKNDTLPPYPETHEYIQRVMNHYLKHNGVHSKNP